MKLKITPKARGFIQKKIQIHLREGYLPRQAVAMAYAKARAKGFKIPKYKR
jgi:hypothetical protein